MIRALLLLVIGVHALIHLLGFAKGFGLAAAPQLTTPNSRARGALWLVAAVALLCTAGALVFAPSFTWIVGALAVGLSQGAISMAWRDARFGTVANVIILAVVVHAGFARGPFGVRATFERVVAESDALEHSAVAHAITDAQLTALPPAVRRYLRFANVVGAPVPRGFRVHMRGRIRSSASAPWMPFTAEQRSFFGPPRRYFFLQASRGGLPIDGLHAYDQHGASMRIRLLSLVPIIDVSGPRFTRTETVTLLNDMCLFAPGSLVDPALRWRTIDDTHVEATYTVLRNTIRATLEIDPSGALRNFWSDDRPALAEDGKTLEPQRWSTPLSRYRSMGRYRLASHGEARYAAPRGDYAYAELDDIDVDVIPRVHKP